MDTRNREIECVATDVAALVYGGNLDALDSTLREYGIMPREYTLSDIRDESVCLIYEDDSWVTFYSERGQRTGETRFKDINDACNEVIRLVVPNGEARENMKSFYLKELSKNSTKVIPIESVKESVKRGFERIASSAAVL